jgi:hypothetical protein
MAANTFQFTFDGGLALPTPAADPPDKALRTGGESLREALTASPALYPIAIDSRADAVELVALTRADYAAASFLDDRLRTPGVMGTWWPWAEVRRAAEGLPARCHFIFHISHVGSTLLSRLLGHHPVLFSLREPAILRILADAHLTLGRPGCPWGGAEFGERLGVYLALWSRTFEPDQTAVIKATSFVGEMAEHLMERAAGSRSVFMFVSPLTFLKALLGGAMSDVTGAAEKRLLRLQRRLGAAPWRLSQLSAGECVAMSWLSEMLALHAAGTRFPCRVLWMDFDQFLGASDEGLVAALRHLGAGGADEAARAILSGPTMRRYAKAPAYAFDAGKRHQLLQEAEGRHGSEIGKGMDWLGRAAAAFPAVEELLQAVASGRLGAS